MTNELFISLAVMLVICLAMAAWIINEFSYFDSETREITLEELEFKLKAQDIITLISFIKLGNSMYLYADFDDIINRAIFNLRFKDISKLPKNKRYYISDVDVSTIEIVDTNYLLVYFEFDFIINIVTVKARYSNYTYKLPLSSLRKNDDLYHIIILKNPGVLKRIVDSFNLVTNKL